jgi:hypothetical protein
MIYKVARGGVGVARAERWKDSRKEEEKFGDDIQREHICNNAVDSVL